MFSPPMPSMPISSATPRTLPPGVVTPSYSIRSSSSAQQAADFAPSTNATEPGFPSWKYWSQGVTQWVDYRAGGNYLDDNIGQQVRVQWKRVSHLERFGFRIVEPWREDDDDAFIVASRAEPGLDALRHAVTRTKGYLAATIFEERPCWLWSPTPFSNTTLSNHPLPSLDDVVPRPELHF